MTTYYVDGAVGADGNAGTSAGAGNAWATIAHGLATMAAGDIVYVKASATYSIGTGLTASTGIWPAATRLVGYTTTPGDMGRPTILATAAIVGLTISATGCFTIENFVLDGGSIGTKGVSVGGSWSNGAVNCLIKNWVNEAFIQTAGDGHLLLESEVTACGGTNAAVDVQTVGTVVKGCKVHGNTVTGIFGAGSFGAMIERNLVYGNTGGTSDGIAVAYGFGVSENTVHGNGRHGVNITVLNIATGLRNNIITGNGGFGIVDPMSPVGVDIRFNYNAFYGNTSGSYSGLSAGPNDVALSGLPYTNAGAEDFSLNNVAGQGAACRAAASGAGYRDLGALQHQDAGGSGPTYFSY